MGTKLSSPGNRRNHPSSVRTNEVHNRGQVNVSSRSRTRSLHLNDPQPMAIPTRALQQLDLSSEENSPNSDGNANGLALFQTRSLPSHLFAIHGLKCPVCSKYVQTDEVELHFLMCLTKPRLNYNDDVLTQDSGECVICLDDLLSGDKIARLPCLCIYHKRCIDTWFKKNRSCPEHPS